MSKHLHAVSLLVLILSACTLPGQPPGGDMVATQPPGSNLPATQPPVSEKRCGDGVCDGPENAQNCPSDCGGASAPVVTSAPPGPSGLGSTGAENSYRVTNPTSGARLYVQVIYPENWNGETVPALVLAPGGIAESDAGKASHLASGGFMVVIFDADGRGRSEGVEDYNGYIQQDGLAAVISAAESLPGLDVSRFGLVSYSYGVTMASGALARHPDLPIKFYIDWEGPVDRNYTTTGCGSNRVDGIQWKPCTDEGFWSQREAVNFIGQVGVPYQRVQSQKDHVQPNNNHAIDIVNAAVTAGLPWVRLNDYPPNQTYAVDSPPAMIPDSEDKRIDNYIVRYAEYIITEVLPTLK